MKIAALIPCLNEEAAIGTVVKDFRAALPEVDIYVYDNGSTDSTASVATDAGVVVRHVSRRGKGHVVRQMFSDVDADIYILVDGDGTYDARSAPKLVQACAEQHQAMVIAYRVTESGQDAYRTGHVWGNRMLTKLSELFFGKQCRDLLSGYRAFSRQFVKSFPALSNGFEIETEMTVHAFSLNLSVGEVETPYRERVAGTSSKLDTYRDGIRIVMVMLRLFKDLRPFAFFSGLAALIAVIAIVLFLPILFDYLETGLVVRFPTAFLCMGLGLTSIFAFFSGLILDTGARQSLEMKRLAFLARGADRPRPPNV